MAAGAEVASAAGPWLDIGWVEVGTLLVPAVSPLTFGDDAGSLERAVSARAAPDELPPGAEDVCAELELVAEEPALGDSPGTEDLEAVEELELPLADGVPIAPAGGVPTASPCICC